MEKKLKIILCVTIMLLIILVGFVGVYTKEGVNFKNYLPRFLMSSEFNGKRITNFKVSDATNEIIYDKDGKEVSSIPEGANEEEYKKETKKVNSDEIRTVENYQKAKKVFEKRLDNLGVKDYLVRMDENTGEIVVELEEGLNTDEIIQDLMYKGTFEIKDSKDGTVYLDNSDLKDVKVLYSNPESDGISVYFNMEFNKEGKKKLLEVSKKYLKPEDENTEENKDENTDEGKISISIERK